MNDFLAVIDEALRSNLQCWTSALRLEGLMIIAPENQTTERWLEWLETEGYLPSTLSWLNRAGLKVRLYECPEEMGSFDLIHHHLHLCIENGYAAVEFLPEPEERLEDYRHSGGDLAMLEVKPATLPEKTREFLKLLQVMDAWSPYSSLDDWSTPPNSTILH